ncbi:MAG: hypothetical protein HRT89_05900 [Lentisphaeria bacterium]|nr:hypothetical protein [Lentisphaeria bacterium]NQZ67585.1 hypothetical protein [Lentisphaeria bacterium]
MDHPFKHFVVLMMENQSFDRLLGFVEGIGKLDGSEYVESATGEKVYASRGGHPIQDHLYDPPHATEATLNQLWGVNGYTGKPADGSGWIKSIWPEGNPEAEKSFMKCFDDVDMQLPAMITLAKNFVVCDRNFSSMPGPTAPNRLFLHAASSMGYTRGIWRPENGLDISPKEQTIFEALDDTDPSLKWNLYNIYPEMNTSMAFPYVREHADRIRSFEQFKDDCSSDNLPAYSVINPNLWENSQHAGGDGTTLVAGDSYIADVYEAIRSNQEVWEKTLFFITYDEAGGYWDSVINTDEMPIAEGIHQHKDWDNENSPENSTTEFDFKYLGVRIPGLIISAWLDHQMDSTVYEHSSVPATVKALFNTEARGPDGYLTVRDQAANDLLKNLKLRDTARTDLLTLPRSSYMQDVLNIRKSKDT